MFSSVVLSKANSIVGQITREGNRTTIALLFSVLYSLLTEALHSCDVQHCSYLKTPQEVLFKSVMLLCFASLSNSKNLALKFNRW